MTTRSITARYEARVERFISDTLKAKAAVTGFATDVATASGKTRRAYDDMAGSAAKGGIAITAALGLAGKAAIDWESAWAGVTKTVDGSAGQMKALEGDLRELATTLPATNEEIAGVAEAAGQLGVKREDILGFTETMIAMGESTNLAAEDAATSMAQISNVMGTMEREGAEGIERLGSTIVALGNAGASTEADIVSMATRLTGAGKMIGATEADVLALANAMSSVGIEAQLGGGVMSRVMQQINSAVISGGEEVEGFAKISGISAAEFAQAWNSDPVAAIDMFVRGLGDIGANGGDAVAALDEVGIKGTENTSVLLRLSGASDILTESLALGKEAWAENSALQEEAEKRYATTASQLEIARNKATDAAIDFGSVLAPAIVTAADAVGGLSEFLADLPPELQGALTGIGGLGAAALLAGAGTIKLISTVSDLKESYDQIAASGPKAGKAMRGLAAAGVVVGIAAVTSELQQLIQASKIAEVDIEDLAESMRGLSEGSRLEGGIADLFRDQGGWLQSREQVVTMTEAIERFGIVANDATADGFISSLERMSGNGAAPKFEKYVRQIDAALVELVESGNADEARRQLDQLLQNVDADNVDEVRAAFTGYNEAIKAGGDAAGAAKGPLGELAGTTNEAGEAQATAAIDAKAYADALDEVQSAITMLGGGLRAEQEAISQSSDAYKAAQEAIKGTSQEQSTALRELSATYLEVSSAQVNAGRGAAEVGATMQTNRDQFIKTAVEMGYSAEYANSLADAYGLIPDQVQTMVSQVGAETAAQAVTDLDETIMGLDGKTVTVKEAGADPSKQRVLKLDGAIFGLDGKTVTVKELGATASGERVVSLDGKIYKLTGKTVTVGVNGAQQAASSVEVLRQKITNLYGKTVTVTTRYVTEGKSTIGGLTRATGGAIYGPGTGTSDSIPAMLSNGEHVWTAAEVQKLGGQGAMYALRAAVRAGSIPRYATGGQVAARPAMYASRPAPATVSPVIRVSNPTGLAEMAREMEALRADFRNVQFQLNMDGQQVARVVTTHQVREIQNGRTRR